MPEHHLVWIVCTAVMQALPFWYTQHVSSIQPVPASAHHTERLSLIGAVEPSLAQLKPHVLQQPPACTSPPPTSTSLPAQATIVLPPSGPVQELPLPAKAPSDMNLFEISDASAPTAPVWRFLPTLMSTAPQDRAWSARLAVTLFCCDSRHNPATSFGLACRLGRSASLSIAINACTTTPRQLE